MKILSSRNGVALIAVLTVLLVLTLLLPVMFKTTENATYSSVRELSRQKAGYLARTGAEMAVATLKNTLKEDSFAAFYDALKNENKDANSTYGITVNDDGYLQASLEPISLYVKNGADDEDPKYISGEPTEEEINGYTFVGKTEITITYNGDPEYYKVDDGAYTPADIDEATTKVTVNGTVATDDKGNPYREINDGYIAIHNDNYMVKSTATVQGQKATRSAAVMETRDMVQDDNSDSYVAYTEQYWSLAPDFVKIIEGDYPTPKDGYTNNAGQPEKNYSYGGNQVFANPFLATSKKEVKAFGKNISGATLDASGYYSKYVYIYSTIGNMHINIPEGRENVTVIDHDGEKGGNVLTHLALGAYPGLNWRIFEYTKSEYISSLQGMNYAASQDSVQRYNFNSFCATDTLMVSLPIELRVNPKRSNRTGDHKIFGYEYNATLFKVLNFQAKDIVFEGRIDIMAGICDQEFDGLSVGPDGDQEAYRGGFINLTAPANTPYSYYNRDRKETVSAGIVYFHEPVYLWFQNYDALGTDTFSKGHGNNGGETMFRTGLINSGTNFGILSGSKDVQIATNVTDDLMVFKLFEAGDVYYFNAEIKGELEGDEINVGVNLANWFLDAKYFPAKKADSDSSNLWEKITHLKDYLYTSSISSLLSKNSSYVEDDMHYIGNMNDDPTLISPEIEDDLYVVWDN